MASEVQVVESFLVAPSEATPSTGLWLSSLDLNCVQYGHTPTVYLYPRPAVHGATDFFDLARLKEAMARALVAYYPLAGRLGVDKDGRIEICCNGEGALFVVAHSDELAMDDFINDIKPSSELQRLFVPRVKPASIMTAIQVTFLKCGGVALGTALHHGAIDAMSAFHFLQTWSSFSRDGDGAAVELPFHDRTLLRARSPPAVHPDTLSVLCSQLDFSEFSEQTATEVFTIPREQVASLKRLSGGATTFGALSALVWQCACAARASRHPPDAQARISFPANVRRSTEPPLPDRYSGNAIIRLAATATLRELASEELPSVAGRIRGAINRMDDEVVRSAIDYLEQRVDLQSRSWPPTGILPATELRVVSWLGMPLYDTDFGWGKPSAFSRAEMLPGGYVILMDDGPPVVDGGCGAIRVVICMEAANMKEFERLLYAKL